MTDPIRPEDVTETKRGNFPPEVMQAWNDIIAKNFSNGSSFIRQNEIAEAIAKKLDITRTEVFDNKYLDIEDIYRAHGWKVEYDKPGYNESYEASFTFRKR